MCLKFQHFSTIFALLNVCLQFVQNNDFLVSTSSGSVQLMTIVDVGDAANTVLRPTVSWQKLHPFKYEYLNLLPILQVNVNITLY